jgi:hypothetical protein
MNLKFYVQEQAEHFSDLRLARKVVEVCGKPSTAKEMRDDWLDACAHLIVTIIEGHIDFAQIEPDSYSLMEEAWYRRVKQGKAYQIWRREDQGSAQENYARAAADLRGLLLSGDRADLDGFQQVRNYLESKYLDSDGKLDESKAKELLKRKARRIWETNGAKPNEDPDMNWSCARLYATMFYENIIGAVSHDDAVKTSMILKAFEFSKSGRYLVINGFEVAIAVYFLDRKVIGTLLSDPKAYDFSMTSVSDWPEETRIPPICAEKFRYDRYAKQIIYEGKMEDSEREALLGQYPNYTSAIEELCGQSRLGLLKEQIL